MRGMVAAVVLAVAAGFAGGYALHSTNTPHCPTEDSCTVSYHGGGWHVTPVVP
jgi:hypothetical protein